MSRNSRAQIAPCIISSKLIRGLMSRAYFAWKKTEGGAQPEAQPCFSLWRNAKAQAAMLALACCCVIAALPAHPREARAQQRGRTRPAPARPAAPAAQTAGRTLVVRTEPHAIIWLDEVRRGRTDASGQLTLAGVPAGRRALRVRASGFRERVVPVLPAQRGAVTVALTRTTDQAELLFQQAEEARERARDEAARRAAAELYRRALRARPRYAEARLGLARTLYDLHQYHEALEEIAAARAARPAYAEASAVEGRTLREIGDMDAAIEAYRRALREARNHQPEAHTGLAIVLEERGQYEEAAASYTRALAQLADSEPILYQRLGAVYERMERYREAVAAYDKFLQLAPNSQMAEAVRSIIDQLRREAGQQNQPF